LIDKIISDWSGMSRTFFEKKMRVISLGCNCWWKVMAKSCGYGGQSDPLDHMNSWTFKKALDLFITGSQDLFDDCEWQKKNVILYSKKYNIKMPHLIGGVEKTLSDYQRRIERFKEYKKDTETNFLFIRQIAREHDGMREVGVTSENIKENYSDDIFSHKFFTELLPKRSKILLLTVNNQHEYHPLTENERKNISNNFYLCESVEDPGWIDFATEPKKSKVRSQYIEFLKYIDQNFENFDQKKAESIISTEKL